jgi:hypothetical protein
MQLFIVMLYVIVLSGTMLSVSLSVMMELHNEKCCYAAFRHAECRDSECHHAECRYAECHCSEYDSGSVIMRLMLCCYTQYRMATMVLCLNITVILTLSVTVFPLY